MLRLSKFKLIFIIFLLINSIAFSQTSFFAKDIAPTLNTELPFKKAINLTTWLESYEHSGAGITYFGKQDFVNIKNLGAEAIRIPIHFDYWSSKDSEHSINALLFETLDDVVKWAEELKIYIILDCHINYQRTPNINLDSFLSKIWRQIVTRYKNTSNYIIYEILDNPEKVSSEKWYEIQGNIIKLIRQFDSSHSIIVGASNRNSIDELEKMPNYNSYNLIYSFQFFEPMLFTHQGADWIGLPNIRNIPFPYDQSKMPEVSYSLNDKERNLLNSYPKDSSVEYQKELLDRAIFFANIRRVPLFCSGFGVYQKNTRTNDRIRWYKTVVPLLDKRKISRANWSYTGDFGMFIPGSTNTFPTDLNTQLISALGFSIPTYKISSWIEDCTKIGKYEIYKNKISQKVSISTDLKETDNQIFLFKRDPRNGERCIYFPQFKAYSLIKFNFSKTCDFTSLYAKKARLEFWIKTTAQDIKFQIWFENSDTEDLKWRANYYILSEMIKNDGEWQKISIPLVDFVDIGAYDDAKKTWINSQGKFSWGDIESIQIQNSNYTLETPLSIKDIEIVIQ